MLGFLDLEQSAGRGKSCGYYTKIFQEPCLCFASPALLDSLCKVATC